MFFMGIPMSPFLGGLVTLQKLLCSTVQYNKHFKISKLSIFSVTFFILTAAI